MTVSIVIPALNEAPTIGRLVRLCRRNPRVDEVIVVDDGSIDGTPEVAARAGAIVLTSSLLGKGASMEDGIAVACSEVVLFLDGDLREVCADLVERMVGPIEEGRADLVKAKFTRDAGRVTILTARPLLAVFFPELAHYEQPLGGIVAVRRSLLREIRLENDYGVDVGLFIDAHMKGARLVEVDIGRIDHDSQSLEALGAMAKQITRVILDRAWRYDRLSINRLREMEELERRFKAEIGLPDPPAAGELRRFALFDMDGTILRGRFIVELAERVGAGAELAHFLDNPRLDEAERTRAIARLFTGVPREVFEEVARDLPLNNGAVDAVVALRKAGYMVGLMTDSFYVAAEVVRRRVFADFAVAHLLRFRSGVATGEVDLSPALTYDHGCRKHQCCKGRALRFLADNAGLVYKHTLAVGDGDNDICMFRKAGVSVAFRARSKEVSRVATYSLKGSLLEIFELPGFRGLRPRLSRRRASARLTLPVSGLLPHAPREPEVPGRALG